MGPARVVQMAAAATAAAGTGGTPATSTGATVGAGTGTATVTATETETETEIVTAVDDACWGEVVAYLSVPSHRSLPRLSFNVPLVTVKHHSGLYEVL